MKTKPTPFHPPPSLSHGRRKFFHPLLSTRLNPNFSNPQSSFSPFGVLVSGCPFISAHFHFKRIALMSTPAQIAANQANSQLSTGPRTEEGKAKSSLNAVKTGLTGRTVLLPSEDAALYEQHIARFMQQYEPVGDEELTLVQSLADTQWRLLRIPSLEAGIYALGRLEFAELFASEDESVRTHLINAKTLLVYQRQLNNLNLQENRLRRHREKDTAALLELQDNRKRTEAGQASSGGNAQLDTAASLYIHAVRMQCQEFFNPVEFGFEFSIREIETRARQLVPGLFVA